MSDVKKEIVNNGLDRKEGKKVKKRMKGLRNQGEILTNVFRSDEEKNWKYLLESEESKKKKKKE